LKRRHKHNKYKDRDWLYREHIEEKKSPGEIASICNVSKQTIIKWINRLNLPSEQYEKNKRNRRRKAMRKRRRQMAYEYLGNKCAICGYDKCQHALEFHHKNPPTKEYNITNGFGKPWKVLKIELDKCVLLCKNCHAETHNAENNNGN